MAKADIPSWTLVGLLVGMLSTYFVNSNIIYVILGGGIGAGIGYLFGRRIK
ncbi:MAG: hypothetical protein AABX98_01945 [Nanoarchaeota archaeon]